MKRIKYLFERVLQLAAVEPEYFDLSDNPVYRQRKEANKQFREIMDRCRNGKGNN